MNSMVCKFYLYKITIKTLKQRVKWWLPERNKETSKNPLSFKDLKKTTANPLT